MQMLICMPRSLAAEAGAGMEWKYDGVTLSSSHQISFSIKCSLIFTLLIFRNYHGFQEHCKCNSFRCALEPRSWTPPVWQCVCSFVGKMRKKPWSSQLIFWKYMKQLYGKFCSLNVVWSLLDMISVKWSY